MVDFIDNLELVILAFQQIPVHCERGALPN
jgi:hypothetical protein